MVLQNIFRRKLRALFATCGVALAVATLVSLTAVTQGMLLQLERLAADYRGDVMVQAAGSLDPLFSQLPFTTVGELRALPEVKAAYPVVSYFTKLPIAAPGPPASPGARPAAPRFRYFLLFALPAGSDLLRRHRLVRGRYFNSGAREVILGRDAAHDLHLDLGDTFRFSGADFRVVGVFASNNRLLDGTAIYSIEDYRQLFAHAKLNLVVLDLHEPRAQIPQVLRRIRERFEALEPIESAKVLDNFRHAALFRAFAFGISIIAVAIAALGILNIMIMSVHERTREIGILRAIGWPARMIAGTIVGEALVLSLTGGAIGAALGAAGTEALIRTVDIGLVRALYPARLWIEAGLLSLAVGAIGAALPAWKAVSIPPIEALRYE